MSEPTSSRPAADRNLLFGVLALQTDFISRDALIKAMQAWVLEKGKALGQILVEQGALRIENRELLEALVQRHLEMHNDDPEKSLAAVTPASGVHQVLLSLGDEDLQASLAAVGSARAADPDATVDGSGVPRPGTLAGFRYRIVRPHAKGGLGEVSVAEDLELHREVALKEIQANHAHNMDSRSRFLLEAEITGRLEHPGIVPVYGLGQYADGRPFYAMRFIKGDNLKEAIRRFHASDAPTRNSSERSLAFRELLGRFVDVCNAVAYAHSRGILHRDLKPGNIMLGKYGETLVVDWGLSKSIDRPQSFQTTEEVTLRPSSGSGVAATQMGSAIGTPAYMSPEQAAGRLDLLGPASDIYSLGATLYALLTGQAPFREQANGDLLAKVQRGELVPPRQIKAATPQALEAICLKAMALRPEERYATALELAADIEHWLADEPVSAWREPWTVRLRRWVKGHRTAVTASAAALGVALLSLGAATVLLSTANQQLREANLEAKRQKGEAEQAAERERQAKETSQANYQMAREALEQSLTKVADNPRLQIGGFRVLRRELLEEASKFYTRFIQERGDDPRLQEDLGTAYFKSGLIAAEIGANTEAVERFQRAAAIFQQLTTAQPDVPQYQPLLARTYLGLADRHRVTGQRANAVKSYEQVRIIMDKLVDAHPDIPEYQRDLARTYNGLGRLQQDTGQRDAAMKSYEQARTLREKMVAAHPDAPQYQDDLANTYNGLGVLHQTIGQHEAALQSYEQARLLQDKLVTAHPDVSQYQHALASTYGGLGFLQAATGQRDAALQSHQQARAIQERLVAAHPDLPDYQNSLAFTYFRLGVLQRDAGEPGAALTFQEQVRTILEKLVAAHPDVLRYQIDLANTYNHIGSLQRATGQWEAALRSHEQARLLLEKLVAAYPDIRDYQIAFAYTLAQGGEYVRATAEVNDLSRSKSATGTNLYNAACVFALSSAAVGKDAKLPPTEREQLVKHYAVHAMELLTQAQAAGYLKNPGQIDHMKKDTDLDAIRSRDDFKKLVGELEKGAGK